MLILQVPIGMVHPLCSPAMPWQTECFSEEMKFSYAATQNSHGFPGDLRSIWSSPKQWIHCQVRGCYLPGRFCTSPISENLCHLLSLQFWPQQHPKNISVLQAGNQNAVHYGPIHPWVLFGHYEVAPSSLDPCTPDLGSASCSWESHALLRQQLPWFFSVLTNPSRPRNHSKLPDSLCSLQDKVNGLLAQICKKMVSTLSCWFQQ